MILGSESLTRRRYAVGTWGVDGTFTAGATTDSTIRGSFQPLNGQELATLPEGERHADQRKVYTRTELRVASQEEGIQADRVSQDGTIFYEVRQVERQRTILPHYKVRLVRVQEDAS